MTYGMWLSVGGLQVNEYRQSLAANNMANVETAGFKRDLAVIHERRPESVADGSQNPYSSAMLDSMGGGVWVKPTFTSMAQGDLEETGRSLDAALFGEGFFKVTDGTDTQYTRDGRFARNSEGELVLTAGEGRYKVLDSNNQPIVLGPGRIGAISISSNGTIYDGKEPLAQLGITGLDDSSALTKTGNSVYVNSGGAKEVTANPQVREGYIERSTVNPITALTDMIEVTRAYELNARMITLQDETLGQAISRVGRVG